MKLAIHKNDGFSKHWIAYCEEHSISYKVVNCYDNDIIQQIEDCDALLWHHYHANYKDKLFAKPLLFSLQQAGKKTFPDFNTGWHFDDKVGQKYLLESINAPLVPSYIFYTKKEALAWIKKTSFPKVFKLRGGAGSSNVKLVKTQKQAIRLVNKAFGKGFTQYSWIDNLKDRFYHYKQGKGSFLNILKGVIRLIYPTEFSRLYSQEKGYAYFQDFIPNNSTDFRIKIVNGNCWGFQRKNRENDFRASGSNELHFNNDEIPIEMIKTAFKIAKALHLQSVAFDFLIKENKPFIVEISYCFGFDERETDNGYWTENLVWHKKQFNPFEWIIDNIINTHP